MGNAVNVCINAKSHLWRILGTTQRHVFFLEIGQKIQLILRYRQVSVCGFDNDEIRIMKKVVC